MSNFRKFISVSAVAILGATNLLTSLTYAQEAKAYDSLTNSDLKTPALRFIMPDRNVYLYAVTEANHYFVDYNGNTHTSWVTTWSEFIYDTTWYLKDNGFAKTWYTFVEWNRQSNGNGSGYAEGAAVWNWTPLQSGHENVYAIWNANRYKIEYDLNDASGTSSWVHSKTPSSLAYDETWNILNPTRTWYGFSGWDIRDMDSEDHIVGWNPSNATTANWVMGTQFKNLNATDGETVHFAARWTRNTNTAYTVEHFLENIWGWYPETAELKEDKTGTTDTDVTPPVQTYTWFTSPSTQTKNINADGSTKFRYEYTRDSFALTLKAGRWVASVAGSGTVTPEASTTTSTEISFKYDEPVKLSFTLKDWYATWVWTWYLDGASQFNMPASAQEKTASATPIVYKIKYTYSWWTPQNDPTTYTVETPDFDLSRPSRIHSNFVWWIGSNWNTPETTVEIPLGSTWDRHYIAKWSCHVWFHDNLDYTECIPDEETNYTVRHWQESLTWVFVHIEEDDQQLKWPTLSGTNAQPNPYPGFQPKPIKQGIITWDGSTTVDVEYTRLTYSASITDVTGITNTSADGQYSDEPNYKFDDKVTLSADTQPGYTFDYWEVKDSSNNSVTVTNSGNIDEATFNMPASSVTIIPHVTTNVYNLTIISHWGLSGSTNRTYTVEDTVTLTNPNRPHSDFAWWSWTDLSEPSMSVSFSGRSKHSTYEETWKCHTWYHASGANECVANTYHINIPNMNWTGHSAPDNIVFTYDKRETLPEAPSQSWYDFVWWIVSWMSGWVEHTIWEIKVTSDDTYTYSGTSLEFMNLTVENGGTVTLTAIWSPRSDTKYVVNHYYKDLWASTYFLSWTDNLEWVTDSTLVFTNLKHDYEWFTYSAWYVNAGDETRPTAGAVTQTTIDKHGNTVINLYYDRNTHTVTLSGDAHVASLSWTWARSFEYGAPVQVSVTAKTWYHFVRWKRMTDNTFTTEIQ